LPIAVGPRGGAPRPALSVEYGDKADDISLLQHRAHYEQYRRQTLQRTPSALLLTAVRRIEGAKASWSEVVVDVWTVPAERMKGKLDHVVPLSLLALEAMGKRNGKFIFTIADEREITNFDVYKTKLDKASGVKGWRLHDLRRTARSLLSRAGVPSEIAERCLAHLPGGVQGRYDRYEYLAEKRDALERLAALIGGL
jgi:integrase